MNGSERWIAVGFIGLLGLTVAGSFVVLEMKIKNSPPPSYVMPASSFPKENPQEKISQNEIEKPSISEDPMLALPPLPSGVKLLCSAGTKEVQEECLEKMNNISAHPKDFALEIFQSLEGKVPTEGKTNGIANTKSQE